MAVNASQIPDNLIIYWTVFHANTKKTHWSSLLTHWGQATHICVSKLTIIGSNNGLSPDRRQAIIWINAGLLLIGPLYRNKLQWNLNLNSNIFIQENAFESVVCETAAILSRPQCVKRPLP